MPGPMSDAWQGSPSMRDTFAEGVAEAAGEDLDAWVLEQQLGPVVSIDMSGIPIQLELDPAYLSKAHVLTRWVDRLAMPEPIVHRYPRTAPRIRVNLRGMLDGVPVVVYAIYEDEREPRLFAMLAELHAAKGSVELRSLLAGLRALEPLP